MLPLLDILNALDALCRSCRQGVLYYLLDQSRTRADKQDQTRAGPEQDQFGRIRPHVLRRLAGRPHVLRALGYVTPIGLLKGLETPCRGVRRGVTLILFDRAFYVCYSILRSWERLFSLWANWSEQVRTGPTSTGEFLP